MVLVFGCSYFVSLWLQNDRLQNSHGLAVVLFVFWCFGGVWIGGAPPKNGKECQSGG